MDLNIDLLSAMNLPDGWYDGPFFKAAEEVIGPSATWKDRCYEISQRLLFASLGARVRYGIYSGPLKPSRPGQKYIRQGWIEMEDGRICDPTIFHVTGDKPGWWIGQYSDHYDILGIRHRETSDEFPLIGEGELVPWPEDEKVQGQIHTLSGGRLHPEDQKEGIPLNQAQWIMASDLVFFEGLEIQVSEWIRPGSKIMPIQRAIKMLRNCYARAIGADPDNERDVQLKQSLRVMRSSLKKELGPSLADFAKDYSLEENVPSKLFATA